MLAVERLTASTTSHLVVARWKVMWCGEGRGGELTAGW